MINLYRAEVRKKNMTEATSIVDFLPRYYVRVFIMTKNNKSEKQ